jgi:5-methylcytosine-specific restriction endonuclease McrA
MDRIPIRSRIAVIERLGGGRGQTIEWSCFYCRRPGLLTVTEPPTRVYTPFLSFDHIIPRSHGGSDEPDNLLVACFDCNTKRARRTVSEYWRMARAS